MSDKTGGRQYAGLRRARGYVDAGLDLVVPRKCRFRFFRIGVDLCAKCGKTRKEHG
jgi:hypothetical protein